MKPIGVIGGVGPLATTFFYNTLVAQVSTVKGGSLPAVIIYSLPMTPEIETAFILRHSFMIKAIRQVKTLLEQSIDMFLRSQIPLAVMPCNTLQPLFQEVCDRKGIKHINLITETSRQVAEQGFKEALIVGTTTTRQNDRYGEELARLGVTCQYLPEEDQEAVSQHIIHKLQHNGVGKESSSHIVERIFQASREVDCVIIGCTDLVGQFTSNDLRKPVIDSLHVLVNRSAQYILS